MVWIPRRRFLKVVGDLLAFLMSRDWLALALLGSTLSPDLKARFRALRSLWTSPVSRGFWLAQTEMSLETATSSMHVFMEVVTVSVDSWRSKGYL